MKGRDGGQGWGGGAPEWGGGVGGVKKIGGGWGGGGGAGAGEVCTSPSGRNIVGARDDQQHQQAFSLLTMSSCS